MIGPGRATGVGVRLERFPAAPVFVIADGQVAGDQINLFPIVVHEGLCRVDTGVKSQEPGPAAALPIFIQGAR